MQLIVIIITVISIHIWSRIFHLCNYCVTCMSCDFSLPHVSYERKCIAAGFTVPANLLLTDPAENPKHARWLQTVRKNLLRIFFTTNFRYSKRTISLASLICEGCGLRGLANDRKAENSRFMHVKLCRLASKKHSYGPKWSQKQFHSL